MKNQLKMDIIKIDNTDDVVTIQITISYVGPAEYIYVLSPAKNFQYSNHQLPLKSFPHEYEIGKGKELLSLGRGRNNWSIQLINPSDFDQDYQIQIEWYQKGALIYTWPKDKKDRTGKVVAHVDHIVFSGNCIYQP